MRGQAEYRQHGFAAHVVHERAVARHDREQMLQRAVVISTGDQAVGQRKTGFQIVRIGVHGVDQGVGGWKAGRGIGGVQFGL